MCEHIEVFAKQLATGSRINNNIPVPVLLSPCRMPYSVEAFLDLMSNLTWLGPGKDQALNI